MQFGFTLKPDHSIERTLALTRQAEAAGFAVRLAVRLARPVAGSLSAPDAHGRGDDAAATRHLRDEPGHPRAVASRRPSLADARRAQRRPDGPRDRAGRLRAARPGQATDHDGHARGGDRRHPRPRRGAARSTYEGTELPLPVDRPLEAARLGRRLRPDGPRDDRTGRRRRDPPAGRSGPDPLVRRARSARPRRPPADPPDPSRSRPRRPAHVGDLADVPRADALVPGPRQQPRRRPREQVPARAAAGVADRLHPGPRRATTTSTTPRSGRPTPASSATR